jgi:NADH dehydrogenase
MAARVAILGGGFAGWTAARRLARRARSGEAEVTLIDARPVNVFWPLLPDVISRRISPENISYSLERPCGRRGIRFVNGRLEHVDLDVRALETTAGRVPYDWLILAGGCRTNYFGQKRLERLAPGLKSLSEAVFVRDLALRRLEASEDGRQAHMIIVGGGYTGYETASHVAYLLHRRTKLSYDQLADRVAIEIVEKADRTLRNVSDTGRAWARRMLEDFGVSVRTGVTVEEIDESGEAVTLTDGRRLENASVVWTAGVAPGPEIAELDLPTVQGKRLAVDEALRLQGRDREFAAGDLAGFIAPGSDQPLRMGVQFSLEQGRCAADNVLGAIRQQPPKPLRPWDPGFVIPLAPGRAAGNIRGLELHGRAPYALHYMMSIFRSWGMGNRAGVAADVTFGRGRQ